MATLTGCFICDSSSTRAPRPPRGGADFSGTGGSWRAMQRACASSLRRRRVAWRRVVRVGPLESGELAVRGFHLATRAQVFDLFQPFLGRFHAGLLESGLLTRVFGGRQSAER